MYVIVCFEEENKVAGVPDCWIQELRDGTFSCCWPPHGADKLIKERALPNSTWKTHQCRVLGKAHSFERMKEKLSIALVRSDVDSTDVELLTTRQTIITSSEESNLTPPKAKKSKSLNAGKYLMLIPVIG